MKINPGMLVTYVGPEKQHGMNGQVVDWIFSNVWRVQIENGPQVLAYADEIKPRVQTLDFDGGGREDG